MSHAIESYVSNIASPSPNCCHCSNRPDRQTPRDRRKDAKPGQPGAVELGQHRGRMAFSNAVWVPTCPSALAGRMFDTLHGLVHPVLLPAVMRFNLPSCVEKMADIGALLLGGAWFIGGNRSCGIDKLEAFCESWKWRAPQGIVRMSPSCQSSAGWLSMTRAS